jgi:hypothetical protein
MLTSVEWWKRVLGWPVLALLAMLIGAEIGAASSSCPADAVDCDLGILDAYGGAFIGLLVTFVVVFVVEVTLAVRRFARGTVALPVREAPPGSSAGA